MEYEYKFFVDSTPMVMASGLNASALIELAHPADIARGWEPVSHAVTVLGRDLLISVLARREQA